MSRHRSLALVFLVSVLGAGPVRAGSAPRLLFDDAALRSGHEIRVEVRDAGIDRKIFLLASRRAAEAPGPPAGLCLSTRDPRRHVAGFTRSNALGVATLEILVPGRPLPEAFPVGFQGIVRSGSQYDVTECVFLPWAPDALWLAHEAEAVIRVIDLPSRESVELDLSPWEPRRLCHDTRRGRVHVASVDGSRARLHVIDATARREAGVIDLPPGFYPVAVAVSDADGSVHVLDSTSGTIVKILPDSREIDAVGSVGFERLPPSDLVWMATPAGEFLVVTSLFRKELTVVDPATLETLDVLDLDPDRALPGGASGVENGSICTLVRGGLATRLFVAVGLTHSASRVLLPVDVSAWPFRPLPASDPFQASVGGLAAAQNHAYLTDLLGGEILTFSVDPRIERPDLRERFGIEGLRRGIALATSQSLVVVAERGLQPVSLDNPRAIVPLSLIEIDLDPVAEMVP